MTEPRAGVYTRVSTQEQGERGYSLEAQVADCRKLAVELGATVVAEYEDQDSGASWDLPGLNAMLDAAKRGDIEMVLVYDPDRLARRMAKQLVIEEELQRSGVVIRYVTLRIGESAEDQLLKNVRSSIAEYERSKIALRTARGRRAKAERGQIVGNGWAPYGYQFARDESGRIVGLEVDPVAATIVRRIFTELARDPIATVCRRLNDEGVPTMHGKRWGVSTIIGIVANPAYLGTAAYGRRDTHKKPKAVEEWLTIAVPPLVDRRTVDAATEGLAHRKKRTPARTLEDDFPLRALLTCAHCGGALSCLRSGPARIRYYSCLRAHPAQAAAHGRPLCPLPGVLAAATVLPEPDAEVTPPKRRTGRRAERGIEDEAWKQVSGALLDAERMAAGLAQAQQQHEAANQRTRSRIDGIGREIERLRTKLRRITAKRMDADPGSESDRALKGLAADVDGTIAKLLAEQATLAAEPSPGLSPEDAASLTQFAAEVRSGIDHATLSDRRRVYDLLKLRGIVVLDESGVQIGKRHRFDIEWSAVIELRSGDQHYKKIRTTFYTPAYEEWEAKYMPQTETVSAT